ncbi:MAG: AMP-binding protein [Alphaproteobacteria bacterium]|nr:AMP-binding protein [Alphaproteobacteria bacterium]
MENDLPSNPDHTPHDNGHGVVQRVLSILRSDGDRVFLRFIGEDGVPEELTYKDLVTHALITSSLFDRHNVPTGSTVVLVLSNPKDVFILEAAALLTGRIPIVSAHPSPKLSVDDFARTLLPLIDNAEPALIISDSDYCSFLTLAIGRRVVSLDDVVTPEVLPQLVDRPDPPLFIQYSSGTMGTKKGVSITQAQLLWQVDAYATEIGLTKHDHIVSWLPFYHDMGLLTALMMPLLTGTPVTLISPFHWVKKPLMLLEVISRDGGTLCWLPNFAYNFLVQAASRTPLDNLDLTKLRGVVNCSEPVIDASHKRFVETFSPCGFNPAALAASYAMAETTFAITSGGFSWPLKTDSVDRNALKIEEPVPAGDDTLVSSGRILPGTKVRILGLEGADLGERRVGEIAVSSPSVMQGYFKNLTATLDAQADGYFKTGDLGYRDGEDLYVTGRIKDLIITAGRNIYPQDIELVVNDITGVIPGRCVAFGVEDEAKGTENVVIVAETSHEDTDERKGLEREIAREITILFEIALADVLLVEAKWLKKSTSGKIARGRNRDRYLDQKMKRATTQSAPNVNPASSKEDLIRKCIHEAAGVLVDDVNAPLLTSGLIDSLALSNLMMALEETFEKRLSMPDDIGFDSYDTISAIKTVVGSDDQPKAKPFKLVLDRQTKSNYVLDGPRDFDALILGSSRTFGMRAARFSDFGLRTFHFGVSGSKAEEHYSMTRFLADVSRVPLKHIIAGIDPQDFAPHWPLDERFARTHQLTKYMEPGEVEGSNGFDIQGPDWNETTSKRIEMYYRTPDFDPVYDRVTGDVMKIWQRDFATIPMQEYSYQESKLVKHFVMAHNCDRLHPRRKYYFEKFVKLTADLGCKLTIYTNPLPSQLAQALAVQTPYAKVQKDLLDWIHSIAHENVNIFPISSPADFGGYDQDYLDGTHMGRVNGDLLAEYLLESDAT